MPRVNKSKSQRYKQGLVSLLTNAAVTFSIFKKQMCMLKYNLEVIAYIDTDNNILSNSYLGNTNK